MAKRVNFTVPVTCPKCKQKVGDCEIKIDNSYDEETSVTGVKKQVYYNAYGSVYIDHDCPGPDESDQPDD